ncbi:MAG: response regulator [Bdellovibrionia bacterium]
MNNKRFVVVDDAAFMREVIKRVLIDLGHTCCGEARDGDEAIAICAQTLPDFIILDMVMPNRNGIQVSKVLKEQYSHIKIIGCSTVDEEKLIFKAYKSGFDAYIKKPFEKEDFKIVLSRVFRKESEVANG